MTKLSNIHETNVGTKETIPWYISMSKIWIWKEQSGKFTCCTFCSSSSSGFLCGSLFWFHCKIEHQISMSVLRKLSFISFSNHKWHICKCFYFSDCGEVAKLQKRKTETHRSMCIPWCQDGSTELTVFGVGNELGKSGNELGDLSFTAALFYGLLKVAYLPTLPIWAVEYRFLEIWNGYRFFSLFYRFLENLP